MQLVDIRNEIINHGFDQTLFGAGRINQYINDGLQLVCSRVGFFGDEATIDLQTTASTASYSLPDFGRVRSLRNTDTNRELPQVDLRMIDRSPATTGEPRFYALDGQNAHLYPTPDGTYNLELRYWQVPATLVNDGDIPALPSRWHRILWQWALKECYASEDDPQTAQYWETEFEKTLSLLTADLRFPSTDRPTQVAGMWDQDAGLATNGWSLGLNWEQ